MCRFLFLLSFTALTLAPRVFAGAYALFDGSFNGWEGDTKNTWRIEEGVFAAGALEKMQPRNEFLATAREFGDFELSLKWKLEGTEGFVNGGVQFRSKRVPNHHEVSGFQADLGAGHDGALYDESRRNKVLARPPEEIRQRALKPGDWNDFRIRAEGNRIRIWLNGIQTVDYTETDDAIPRSGIIALQIHGGAKSIVRYRNLIIEELGTADKSAAAATPGTGPVQQRFADPLPAPPREPFKDGKFAIRPGEVIVFTGGTNMVRLIEQGGVEAGLAQWAAAQRPRFRNMAWEGDTVYEQWRDQNFGSWRDQMEAVNATCIVTWFGQMEALDNARTLAEFEQACAKLLDEFQAITPRLAVILPAPFDHHAWPDPQKGLPDKTPFNERLLDMAAIMKRLAAARGAVVIDWPELEKNAETNGPFERTINGVHLTDQAIRHCYKSMLADALGASSGATGNDIPLVKAVQSKNRLWHDCWKAMNWAFAYSDRTEQPFGKGVAGHPPMAVELEQYKPLIREADERIQRLALGENVVTPPPKTPSPLPATRPPAEEQATFKVRDGFAVNLFASEADGLVKPLSMRWDHRGRLWAACSPEYPQLTPGIPPSDYILVCEDTDGDGRADKFNKWAEGLTMPMGIEFSGHGVYVCESTRLVHFPGDGTGKAGEPQVILSGFGTGDSHQMINSLRWGPDGCLWFSQGLHIFSRIETPHGIVHFDRAGIWRFNPRTWKLQGFFGNAAAGANCWGVTFDDRGQVFHCAADNNPGFYTTPGLGTWSSPPSYYAIGSLAVSAVKGMCLEFINGSHLPPDLQGVLCKPVYFANQLQLFKLVEDGSGFITEDNGPLLTSSDTAFRPLGVQTGPDGALYVCDWYNPVIGHYQASYRDPNRDKIHGRIWRITANDRPLVKRPPLENMDATQWIEQLRSPERWVRDQARRLLFDEPDTAAKLTVMALDPASGPDFLYEALSVLAGQGEVGETLLDRALTSSDARLRAFAVRVWSQLAAVPSPESPDGEKELEVRLATLINDPHPRVRLEAVIAAGYIPTLASLELACGVLDHPRDRFIDYALANTVRALQPVWSGPLERGALTFKGNAAHLAFVLQTAGAGDTSAVLRKALLAEDLSPENRRALRVLLISAGGQEDLTFAIGQGPQEVEIVRALTEAARRRHVSPSQDFRTDLAGWAENGYANPLHAVELCRLAAAWNAPEIAERLLRWMESPDDDAAPAAVRAWAEWKGKDAAEQLGKLAVTPRQNVALAAISELVPLDTPQAVRLAVNVFKSAALSEKETASLLTALLAVQSAPGQLAAAFAAGPPGKEQALALLKALGTSGRTEEELSATLRKAAGLSADNPVPAYSADLVASLVTAAKTSGDAKRGERLFMAAQSACTGCHRAGEAGGLTGPDLTAVGRGMTPELITESVLWPQRQIKEGFFLTTVTTRDGKVFTGYRQSEDAKGLHLRAPGLNTVDTIPADHIRERNDTGTLMPGNLTGWMTPEERSDLLRYLFDLGK